jgi:hypothetical protein
MASRVLDLIAVRWKTFFVLAVVIPAVLMAADLTVLQRNEASVGLWAQAAPSAPQAGSTTSGESPSQAQADAIMQAVPTKAFFDALRQALDRAHVGADAPERNQLAATAVQQVRATSAGSHLVVLAFPCDLPSTCVPVLGAAVDAYNQQAAKLRAAESGQIQAALANQLNDAQNALVQAENAVATYLAQHPGETASSGSTDPQVDLLVGQLSAAKQSVLSVQGKLTDLQVAAASRAAQGTLTTFDPPHLIRRGIVGDGGVGQAALILAGCLAVAAVYLVVLYRLDDTAHDPRVLERRLHVPLLVTIPRFSAMRRF